MSASVIVAKAYALAIGTRLKAVAVSAWALRAEAAAVLALMAGWSLVWWGLSDILARWIPQGGFLAIGAGLFLMSCFGWRMLRTIATVGLYALTRTGDE